MTGSAKRRQNFGEVWVPVAVAQLRTSRNTFDSVLMYVDSGAVVSLLRRSIAEELGLSLEAGRRVSLNNVGGSRTEAFVHELEVRFAADETPIRTPFAIATTENVPNLLGRLGVFECRRIVFEPMQRRTWILVPE